MSRMCLQTLVFKETQVQTRDGTWYLMRIIPYRTANNIIDGVVITFSDITESKKYDRYHDGAHQVCRGHYPHG